MAKTNGEHTETCGRCGHPKADHVKVTGDGQETLVCPTSLYLKDELHSLIGDEQPS